jgi:hypothetical protein
MPDAGSHSQVTYTEVECEVLDHDRFSNGERTIDRRRAEALVASGHYRPSTGFPYGAQHYRRPIRDGSCLHLVIGDESNRLHHDAFNPHAGPYALCMHLTGEAKSEVVAYCAMAWSVVKLLAR